MHIYQLPSFLQQILYLLASQIAVDVLLLEGVLHPPETIMNIHVMRDSRSCIKCTFIYSIRHPVRREVLKFMPWKVPMAGWPQLWLATAPAEPRNFSQQS